MSISYAETILSITVSTNYSNNYRLKKFQDFQGCMGTLSYVQVKNTESTSAD